MEIGIVRFIPGHDDDVVIEFPSQSDWIGKDYELEVVKDGRRKSEGDGEDSLTDAGAARACGAGPFSLHFLLKCTKKGAISCNFY